MFVLRDYQLAAVEYGADFFAGANRGKRGVMAAPTGSGKSLVERALQLRLGDGFWIVTPRLEIARGILAKAGYLCDTFSELVNAGWAHRIVTPVRFRNALARGEIASVRGLIMDEGHHALASTWEQLQLLAGMPPSLLFTATPFRGTSRGTAQFLAEWGQPVWMITFAEAIARHDVALPVCSIMPLVDDDQVQLNSNGEFDVTSVESAYGSRLTDLADASLQWLVDATDRRSLSGVNEKVWDRPTVYAVPGVELAADLASALNRRGAPAVAVTGRTKRAERNALFDLLVRRELAIVQVAVLGEGVDLPVRRLVDAAPKMSPVAWMQQLGRATRPVAAGEQAPSYVCTNRNLSRHAYLLEGLLPPSTVAASDEAFGRPSRRAGARAMGLEAVGKFKPAEARLLDGTTLLFYNLVSLRDGRAREYGCVVHPACADPLWAERVHGVKADGSRDWGRWVRCEAPVGIEGYASQAPREPTPKQMAWWERSAEGRGLDASVKVTRKNFGLLPVLFDLGVSFRTGPTYGGR